MAASRLVALAALCAGGCDLVLDIDGKVDPCELRNFDGATVIDIVEAEHFSINGDATFGVVSYKGAPHEVDLRSTAIAPIDLGLYNVHSLSLNAEGTALFYTTAVEPPVLKGALRMGETQWKLDAVVPRGTYAGTPTIDLHGPRRLIVKLREAQDEVQEYEDVNGVWTPIGEPHVLASRSAPNLVTNGLTMVYIGHNDAGEPGIYAAQRPTMDEWFGAPELVLAGGFVNAQLVGRCEQLYATDGSTLRRYE